MGEPYKERDPEKGQAAAEAPQPSINEAITNIFSKAGEGITSAFTKAGEGIHATGTTLKDSAKSAGAKVAGLGSAKTPQKQKPKPKRSRHEKNFHKNFKLVPREEPKDSNIVGNITKLLPANTFLMFQTLAPLATNGGHCGRPEVIMTAAMLIILASTCMLVCFTDTIQFNGKVYNGLVTPSGLWNPSFKGDPSFTILRQYELEVSEFYDEVTKYKAKNRGECDEGSPKKPPEPRVPYVLGSTYSSGNSQYKLNATDFLHAVLAAMAFGTLTMLTDPVSTCFYPKIPSTVVKTLPLLVGFVISAIFAFSPPARNGIAHPLSPKVPSQMDNYKPDSKGVADGPSLPPKPAGKGDQDHAKPKPVDDDDDDLGGSVKKYMGKFFGSLEHEKGKSGSTPERYQLDGMKALASGVFSKYGDDIKHGAANRMHSLEGDVKEATHLLLKAAPAVAELSKDNHVTLALQEAAKSVANEALVAGLVNAGAHPALAIAAVQSAAQGAKDADWNQLHQELQAATSAPLAGLSMQLSTALTRANPMLQSAGSPLSLPSDHDAYDALSHQAAQVLLRRASGLSPNVHAAGSEAAAIALATGQALMQAGYQLPGAGQSPQAAALNAFAQNVGNELNLNSAHTLMKGATSLVQRGGKSLTEVHDELARQGAAFPQGLNSQMQTFYFPGSSAAQTVAGLARSGSQTLSPSTLAANLAAGVAWEAGTFLHDGVDHSMAAVQAEIARQKAAAVQSIAQPVSTLVEDATSTGSQGVSNVMAELIKPKEGLTQGVNSQARALSTQATSVAQDLAALVTTQMESQPTVSTVNSQFLESLARGVAQGMAQAGSQQPAASVAIDVASLLQQGSQMHAQVAQQASALSPQMQAAAAMLQLQASFKQFPQPSVNDTHMALQHLASQLSRSPDFQSSQLTALSPPSWRDNASPIIEEVTNRAGQRGIDRLQRGASQLPSVTEETVAQIASRALSASPVWTASSEIIASTSEEVAGQAALASLTRILRSDRPESTEIVDSISTEEITSESEIEHSNRGEFRGGGSESFNLQGPVTRKQ